MGIRQYPALSTAGSANVKGSYSQIVASTAEAVVGLTIVVAPANSTANVEQMIDIAVGAAGVEVVLIADLQYANSNYFHTNNWSLTIPVGVAAGVRLAVRTRSPTASLQGNTFVWLLPGANTSTTVDTLGPFTAGSYPTQVTSGGSNAYGSYVQLTASAPHNRQWMTGLINQGNRGAFCPNQNLTCAIGVGAAGAEVLMFEHAFYECNANSVNCRIDGNYFNFPMRVSAGDRLAVKMLASSSAETFGVTLYLADPPLSTGDFSFRQDAFTAASADSYPTQGYCVAAGPANVYGSYTQIVASSPRRNKAVSLSLPYVSDDSGKCFDIATGAAGAEVVVVSQLFTDQNNLDMNGYAALLPFGALASTRWAARTTRNNNFGTDLTVALILIPGSTSITHMVGYGSSITAVPTSIDCGAVANVKSAYTQFTASTTTPIGWLHFLTKYSAGGSYCDYSADIATGAAGAEVIVIPDVVVIHDASFNEEQDPMGFGFPMSPEIAASTRLAVRASADTTSFPSRVLYSAIFAADVAPSPACSGGGAITVVADPADGVDTFAGRTVTPRAWLALGFANTTTESTGYFALDAANHPDSFFGGPKRGILRQIGTITRQLSDRFSSYKMGSCALDVDDASRFFSQAENGAALFGGNTGELWQNREGRIYAASPATIAASGVPHTLFRGIWRTHESEGLARSLSLIDILGSEFSDFNLEQQHPRRKVKDVFTNTAGVALAAATTDRDLLAVITTANGLYESNKGLPIPIAYGKLSDKSVSTITTAVPPVQASLGSVVAQLQVSVTAGTTDADWGDIIGHADAITLQGMGTVPSTYDGLAEVIGYADLDYLLQQSTGGGVTVSEYDSGKGKIAPRYAGYYTCADSVVRHVWVIADSAIMHVEGRYLDGVAFSADEPDYHDPTSANWSTVSGTATPYLVISGQTVTVLFMDQGERANKVVSGSAKLTLNICGREDIGDASGSTIIAAPRVIFHLFNQSIFHNYLTGTWAAPATSIDGVPWVNSQSFADCEAVEIVRIGGAGYELAIYLDETLALRDLLGRLQMNTDLRFGQNKHGQVVAYHLNDQLNLTTCERITDAQDLIAPSKFSRKLEELENATDYDWDFRPADGTFEEPDHLFSNAVAITANRGRTAKLDRRELFYVLHQATADDVAARGLSNGSGYVPRYGTFVCNFNVVKRVELGDVVLVTDVDDQGSLGQVDRPYWVLGIDTFVGTFDQAPSVTLLCQDVTRFFGTIGVWGPDTLGNWVGETQDNRRTYQFWASDSGFFADGAAAKEWR